MLIRFLSRFFRSSFDHPQDALETSSGFVDKLLENLPLMVFVKDAKDLSFVRFNKAGLDLLGFSRNEILGKSDLDMFPKDQADHFMAKDREVLSQGNVIDIPLEYIDTKFKGKRVLHTKKIPILGHDGHPLYLLGVSEDITERIEAEKLREKELVESSARLERSRIQERETFIANAISSLSVNLDFQETLNNLAALLVPALGDWSTVTVKNEDGKFERLGCFHQRPELQPLLDEFNKNYPPSDKDIELLRALDHGESFLLRSLDHRALELRSQDRRKHEIYESLGTRSSMVVPIKHRDKVLGAISIARGDERRPFDDLDLTLTEEIGRRVGVVLENSMLFKSTQEAVKARDEFLSIASHELKTPITSLRMQLEMLQRSVDTGTPENFKTSLGKAISRVDRLTHLVNDLLNVSKFGSGKMDYTFEIFSLNELLSEVVESVTSEFNHAQVDFQTSLQTDVSCKGDTFRIEQVLVNILNNALKYGNGTPVKLFTENFPGYVEVNITDSGRGIPPEYQKKIFEKFERGDQDKGISGLGLGLYISREIIRAHGGRIELESEPGSGSHFKIVLPTVKSV